MLASRVYRSGAVLRLGCSLRTLATVPQGKQIKSLEDLASLDTLEGVDPELIKRLINEKTQEYNTQDELKLLKDMQREQERLNEVPLKRFTRPLWMFILMASTFYLGAHLVWWKLEYEEREAEYKKKVESLENTLDDVLSNQAPKNSNSNTNSPWYKFW
ncbi:Inner membrane assembly complex subunit 17 [Nakaseomyces bracarensis]|uniref:Inner membrane assembly complex subunit 17 n=1 Tax=Nakaseomyces bracarensis TaxID=273131 RepID=A0ABR4NU51_9SACH